MDKTLRYPISLLALASALFLGAIAGALWLQGRSTTLAGLDVPTLTMAQDTRLVIGAASAALAALLLLTAIALLIPRRRGGTISLPTANGGSVEISAATVEQAVAEDVRALQFVTSASAHAKQEKRGIAVDLEITLRPDAELPAAIEQATARVESTLAQRYGATIARRPHIAVRYASAPEARTEVKAPVTS